MQFFSLRVVPFEKGGKYFLVRVISLWGVAFHLKTVWAFIFQGCWRKIVVDDTLPFDENDQLMLPCTTMQHEVWPMLLAKALIKVAALEWVKLVYIFSQGKQQKPRPACTIVQAGQGFCCLPYKFKIAYNFYCFSREWRFLTYWLRQIQDRLVYYIFSVCLCKY